VLVEYSCVGGVELSRVVVVEYSCVGGVKLWWWSIIVLGESSCDGEVESSCGGRV